MSAVIFYQDPHDVNLFLVAQVTEPYASTPADAAHVHVNLVVSTESLEEIKARVHSVGLNCGRPVAYEVKQIKNHELSEILNALLSGQSTLE